MAMDTETYEPPLDDESQAFLESLPNLEADETFVFSCHPGVPCFNRCCADLTMPLTPYDVLRLRRGLGMSGEDFLSSHANLRSFPDTGFPLPLLKMQNMPGSPCPFVSPAGCTVYEDRSAACRAYPLGRGARMGKGGSVVERFFLVREDHCLGFDENQTQTPRNWLSSQELAPYNASNDRYMRLMAMVKVSGQPISPRLAKMCVLCLYQVDAFKDFILEMGIFDKLELDEIRKEAVLQEEEARLDFAYDWLELVIFGEARHLARKA